MKRLLAIISVTIAPFLAKSQQIEYFNDLMSDMYNFAIYEPAGYDPVNSTDMPVVMFLHGRSMSIGLDGYRYGTITSIEMGFDILEGQPALVLEPNARGNEGWGSVKLHKVYEFLKAHYAFDHDKFYVIGMSMGGWGTLNYVNKYPDEVAACIGICGGCDAKTPCGLNKVPTWIIHAADDETTDVAYSDRVVEAMKTCGSTNLLKYSRLDSGGHSLINYFRYRNLYTWLFKHSRANRRFDTSIDFVSSPDYPRYYGQGGSGESIYITATELAKIQARTPRQKGSNTMASNSGTTSSNGTPTKPNNGTTPSSNSSSTTKPATNTTSSSSNNKPSTTKKPTTTSTSTSKPNTATVKPVTTSEKGIYIVKEGDTMKKIAKKHKIKYKKLLQINHFTKDKKIKPGDKIKVE